MATAVALRSLDGQDNCIRQLQAVPDKYFQYKPCDEGNMSVQTWQQPRDKRGPLHFEDDWFGLGWGGRESELAALLLQCPLLLIHKEAVVHIQVGCVFLIPLDSKVAIEIRREMLSMNRDYKRI